MLPPSITPAGNDITQLESFLLANVLGQEEVIPRIAAAVERAFLGLSPETRPRANLLFLGPTGTGKTETTLLFSEFLYGPNHLFRFDMSEFQHEDTLPLFIGDSSGDLGRLGRCLQAHAHGVLLFDEMEKAHPKILDLFLQMLEPGRITCGPGVTFSTTPYYIVLTSNVGSDRIVRSLRSESESIRRAVDAELMAKFRKEFVNRFHDVLIFNRLPHDVQREIGKRALNKELNRLKHLGFMIEASDDALEFLIRHGIHKTLGARPMVNAVIRYVGDALRIAIRKKKTSGTLVPAPDHQSLVLQ